MEKRDYDLELIRMEFMDDISQIATEAWESQKTAVLEQSTGPISEEQKKQYYPGIHDNVLLTQRWWVEKQSEFVSKLIADYKSNIFFRQIAQNCENDLITINKNLKNQNFLTALFTNKVLTPLSNNSSLNSKFITLSDLVNRCFTLKDDTYKVGDENISLTLRVGLLEDLLTSYLSGHYATHEKIDDKYISKYPFRMYYLNFLPMHFISGADVNPKLDLTYFTKYFECYCNFINKLLRKSSSAPLQSTEQLEKEKERFELLLAKQIKLKELKKSKENNDKYKIGGRKKTRKYQK